MAVTAGCCGGQEGSAVLRLIDGSWRVQGGHLDLARLR